MVLSTTFKASRISCAVTAARGAADAVLERNDLWCLCNRSKVLIGCVQMTGPIASSQPGFPVQQLPEWGAARIIETPG